MEAFVVTSLCVLVNLLLLQTVISKGQSEHARLPPRGWNSYDSFSWIISEEEFLHNTELVAQRLKANGYEYVVVDYLWYRRKVEGAYPDSLGFDVIDKWGRMIPDPGRWTSSKDGKGFTEVAKKVHSMGLKFGIHVMRGISTQAVNANTPILDITKGSAYEESGRQWYAKDIGLKERACAWMSHGFMSVNTKLGAGRAFLRSLYQQYADWGVDFVKHDCVFGDDLDLDEITIVSEVLRGLNRPILYSISPGTSVTPAMAKEVHGLVNMYRITADDWDKWKDVASHFDIARDFATANMVGAQGLLGKSWPDLDMLPLGWLTNQVGMKNFNIGSNEGPHRRCGLTLDEQKTQMTLWSMAKSPLMFGGDMRNLDETTFNVITNPTLLEINSFSSNNKEFPHVTSINGLRFRARGLSWESRSLADNDSPGGHNFSLSNCMDPKAKGWSSEAVDNDLQKICWKGSTRSRYEEPFCLYKRETLLASDEEMMYEHQYQGKFHLLAADTMDSCFSGSPERKLTSKEFRRGSFSPCKWDANQMWELRHDGTLKNSYSGLCVSVNTVKVNADSGGIRSWIATGRRGEIYVAFFNLNPQGTVISAKISDLVGALRGRNLNNGNDSCRAKEVWSGKDLGEVKETLSTPVHIHGCALFVLTCH